MSKFETHKSSAEGKTQTIARKSARAAKRQVTYLSQLGSK